MVRLYKKLYEYGATMEIVPDVYDEEIVSFIFKKDEKSASHPIHTYLIANARGPAETVMMKHLDKFIDSLK